MGGEGEGKVLVVSWADGVLRLLVARGRRGGMLMKTTYYEISLAYGGG